MRFLFVNLSTAWADGLPVVSPATDAQSERSEPDAESTLQRAQRRVWGTTAWNSFTRCSPSNLQGFGILNWSISKESPSNLVGFHCCLFLKVSFPLLPLTWTYMDYNTYQSHWTPPCHCVPMRSPHQSFHGSCCVIIYVYRLHMTSQCCDFAELAEAQVIFINWCKGWLQSRQPLVYSETRLVRTRAMKRDTTLDIEQSWDASQKVLGCRSRWGHSWLRIQTETWSQEPIHSCLFDRKESQGSNPFQWFTIILKTLEVLTYQIGPSSVGKWSKSGTMGIFYSGPGWLYNKSNFLRLAFARPLPSLHMSDSFATLPQHLMSICKGVHGQCEAFRLDFGYITGVGRNQMEAPKANAKWFGQSNVLVGAYQSLDLTLSESQVVSIVCWGSL